MQITVCHKSCAVTNLEANDFCHIEVDGAIVWYPDCASETADTPTRGGVDAVVNPQQLKQAIALVRQAGDKYISPDDPLMTYRLLLTTIEQRACV